MKTNLQSKHAFSVQMLTRNQSVYLHIKMPKKWLFLLEVLLAAILTSTPFTQVMEMLAGLLK